MFLVRFKKVNKYNLANYIDKYPKAICLIVGAGLSLAFAPFFFFPAVFCLSILLFYAVRAKNIKIAFLYGYIFGIGFFTTSLYWISNGVAVFINEFWWLLPFSFLGLPSFLALYIGLLSLMLWLVRKRENISYYFATFWVVLELIRENLFTGFPWNLLAYTVASNDYLTQISSIIGSYGLSFILSYIGANFIYIFQRKYKLFLMHSFIGLLIFISVFLYGFFRLNNSNEQLLISDFKQQTVKIVQPSIKEDSKWDQKKLVENFNLLYKLSTDRSVSKNTDIIIWPEAAVIFPLSVEEIYEFLKTITFETNSILITGGVTYDHNKEFDDDNKHYTSIYAIDPNGEVIFNYHKFHLVPFGEYVPFRNILPIKKISPGIIDYSPGSKGFYSNIKKLNLKVKPLVCYEIIFPDLVRHKNNEIDVIINTTNDVWYGNSSGPYQHFYTAKMRAVENGLPIIRAANNGISAIFDSFGRVVAKTSLDQVTVLVGDIPPKLNYNTLYSIYGNLFFYIFLMHPFFNITFYSFKRKNKIK